MPSLATTAVSQTDSVSTPSSSSCATTRLPSCSLECLGHLHHPLPDLVRSNGGHDCQDCQKQRLNPDQRAQPIDGNHSTSQCSDHHGRSAELPVLTPGYSWPRRGRLIPLLTCINRAQWLSSFVTSRRRLTAYRRHDLGTAARPASAARHATILRLQVRAAPSLEVRRVHAGWAG